MGSSLVHWLKYRTRTFSMPKRGCYENNTEPALGMGWPPYSVEKNLGRRRSSVGCAPAYELIGQRFESRCIQCVFHKHIELLSRFKLSEDC